MGFWRPISADVLKGTWEFPAKSSGYFSQDSCGITMKEYSTVTQQIARIDTLGPEQTESLWLFGTMLGRGIVRSY